MNSKAGQYVHSKWGANYQIKILKGNLWQWLIQVEEMIFPVLYIKIEIFLTAKKEDIYSFDFAAEGKNGHLQGQLWFKNL